MVRRRTKQAAEARMWLDELPEEICARIARFVTRGSQNDDGLCLAHTSPKQERAVISTLSHKLVVDYVDHENKRQVLRWAKLLSNNVREVNVLDWDIFLMSPFRYGCKRRLQELLSAPTLQTAEIMADKVTLLAIQNSVSIRKLRVHLSADHPSRLFLETLQSLKLEDLTLECTGFTEDTCAFVNMPCFSENNQTLAECFSELRALEVRCDCEECDNPIWRFLPMLRSVREVRLISEPPEDAIPTLQSLDAVQISNQRHGKHLARQLGANVTKLHVQDEALDADDVADLRNCPNIVDLSVIIADGSELLLFDTMSSIRHLRSLDLMFEMSVFDSYPRYYEPAPGVMMNIVSGLHSLETLSLPCMRLELSELQCILKSVGPRLRSFKTSCDGQEESELGRLEALLCITIRNNSGLQSFELKEWLHDRPSEEDAQVAAAEKEQRRRLRVLVRLLMEHAPLLNGSFLEDFVQDRAFSESGYRGARESWWDSEPGPCMFCCTICMYFTIACVPAAFIFVGNSTWRACKWTGKAIRSCWNGSDETQ